MTLNDIQKDIAEWSEKTFGSSRIESKIIHLQYEVEELQKAPKSIGEMADIMILLLDIAHTAGHEAEDLVVEAQMKMKLNKARRWGKPNAHGVVEHLPDAQG